MLCTGNLMYKVNIGDIYYEKKSAHAMGMQVLSWGAV